MPRYFFHIHHGVRNADENGEDLPDNDAAWKEATITAGRLLQDLDGTLKPDLEWRMEVTDEAGNIIWVLRLLAEKHR
ncbi:hypothetical protein [Bradyrhizobium sp. NAS96.2]|uniref:DUF6894 family protein n=1 Tax=Bradyrhizobium sp. NAS96.2 TaxID=1680160 RepID=UPI00093CA4F2|nr:hypothetical protein [Bradyrhizobium sp. NAS96.2]OKO72751.1 hypothetical protein AC628_25655 [Bradyrhizobium sp. NAS96.2]